MFLDMTGKGQRNVECFSSYTREIIDPPMWYFLLWGVYNAENEKILEYRVDSMR